MIRVFYFKAIVYRILGSVRFGAPALHAPSGLLVFTQTSETVPVGQPNGLAPAPLL